MVKIGIALILVVNLYGDLQQSCLNCHQKQQIPDELIYKRYLMKYSTKNNITKAITTYIKNPNKENSIMPLVFFSKFPMKEKVDKNEKVLKKNILEYIDKFDIKKRLVKE